MTENEDSMYKNLGDLLNQVLNKGTIPHINCNNEEQNQKENNNQLKKDQITKQNEQNQANSQNNKIKNGKITKNQTQINKKSIRFFKKKEKQPSTVIKMHKYTENIQFSPEITIIQSLTLTAIFSFDNVIKFKLPSKYNKAFPIITI